jgi:hypothetical protein
VVLLFPVKKIRKRGRRGRELRLSIPYPHNAFGIIKGQWFQQDPIDHTKDRRIRPNAEGERDHRNRGETRMLAKTPNPVANVVEYRSHDSRPHVQFSAVRQIQIVDSFEMDSRIAMTN